VRGLLTPECQQTQVECSRLKQQLMVHETQVLEKQNSKKYNLTGTKDKQLPIAIRHYAQGFTFTTNFWTVERPSVIVTTDIPADFNPSTCHTFIPATPNLARKHALHCFLWELNEYLPDEHKHVMRDVAEMKKAHLPVIIAYEYYSFF